jgi:poly-gamma-glutamate synthesis protein (capsule biosynthesis protein)
MVSINFVGDVATFRQFEINNVDPFQRIQLPDSNYNVANLEFPLPTDACEKSFYDVDDNYRVSSNFSDGLLLSKFNLFSLANNHVMDYGQSGVESTVRKIHTKGVATFGVGDALFNKFDTVINDISFLFIGVVKRGRWDKEPGKVGPDPYDIDKILLFITENKNSYDHIIVFPHWGTELVDAPDPKDVKNARLMIDSGASCVIGHHPHVSQGIESYSDGLIAYSLGSFIYLSEYEKGNRDRHVDRDISICLNVFFSKKGIIKYTPYKYQFDRAEMIPKPVADFNTLPQYNHLCSVINDSRYYSNKIRKILLKRELHSFFSRFKEAPLSAVIHYLKYIKFEHFKKIVGKN